MINRTHDCNLKPSQMLACIALGLVLGALFTLAAVTERHKRDLEDLRSDCQYNLPVGCTMECE